MRSFDQFLAVLSEVPDPRRAEGRIYKLPYVLLFSILAVITGLTTPLIFRPPRKYRQTRGVPRT